MDLNKRQTDLMTIEGTGNLYKKMIAEISDYAIIVLDKNGIIRNWNKGAEKIKQYAPEEIIGKHFSIFYLPEDLENKLPQKLLNQAEYTGSATHEGWRKRKDGSKFWGSITITAIHNDNAEVIGYCKVTRDVTDKKNCRRQVKDKRRAISSHDSRNSGLCYYIAERRRDN